MRGRGLLLVLGTIVFAGSAIWHFYVFDRVEFNREFLKVVSAGGISSAAFSASWYEPRIMGYDRGENSIYPELPSINRFSFVYRSPYGK